MKLNKIVIASLAALGAATAFAAPSVSSLQAQLNSLQNRVNSLSAAKGGNTGGMFVQTNAAVSYNMMNNQNGVGRELMLLNARKNGHLGQGVYLGGFAEASAIYNKVSNKPTTGTFASVANHASNFSTAANTGSSATASEIVLPRLEMNVIADMNSWATGYFSFDANNITGSSTSTLAVNKAFVVLGNLNKMPVYAFFGRNTLDFGSFATVNFNTMPLNRLEFQATGNEAGLGLDTYGLNASVAAANGNTTANGSNTLTKNGDSVNNFVLNGSYGMNTAGADWRVGAGYLSGARAKATGTDTSAAWDLNGTVGFGAFDILGEYTTTASKVNANGNKLKAWDLGASYHFPLMGKTTKVNLDYSKVTAQYSAKEWVLGMQQQTFKNVWMGVEYSNEKGVLASNSTNSVYNGGSFSYGLPTSNNGVSNSTLLLDVQGAF